jgi:hypothetical protein
MTLPLKTNVKRTDQYRALAVAPAALVPTAQTVKTMPDINQKSLQKLSTNMTTKASCAARR